MDNRSLAYAYAAASCTLAHPALALSPSACSAACISWGSSSAPAKPRVPCTLHTQSGTCLCRFCATAATLALSFAACSAACISHWRLSPNYPAAAVHPTRTAFKVQCTNASNHAAGWCGHTCQGYSHISRLAALHLSEPSCCTGRHMQQAWHERSLAPFMSFLPSDWHACQKPKWTGSYRDQANVISNETFADLIYLNSLLY